MKKKPVKQGYFVVRLVFFIVKEIMEQISLFPWSKKDFVALPSSFVYRNLPVVLNRRPYQRSLRLYIKKKDVIYITCSLSVNLKQIKSFLSANWPWVQKQILAQQKIRKKYPEKTFREGELFLFRGRKLTLKYKKNQENLLTSPPEKLPYFYAEKDKLVYFWREGEDISKALLKNKLRAFYESTGERHLKSAVSVFSARMGLFPKSLRIGAQKSLWGSCSSKGRVSLNWRLVATPPEVLNYVVIHELAHLKYLNHSEAFWSLVAKFSPEYEEHEQWLKKNVYALDFLLLRSDLHG